MNKAQQLAERLKQYIPSGDGYNSEFANDLAETIEYLSLKEQRDELQVLVKISLEASEMMISDERSMLEVMKAIHSAIAKAKGESGV